jgi:hypothetical protein
LTLTGFVELLTEMPVEVEALLITLSSVLFKGTATLSFATTQEFHVFNSYGKSSEVKLAWALSMAPRGA